MYADTRADDLVDPLHPRAAAPQPAAAAGAGRRGRHRRHHPDRRPGPDHRPHRRAAGRPAQDRARLRHRPHVRRRDDRGDHGRRRHRLRRVRRRHRRRRRAHGPPPDGRGRRPEPADPRREAGRPVRAGHGRDRGEPARPAPAHHQGARRRVRARLASRRPPRRTPTASSSPTWCRSPPATPRPAGAWPPSTRRRADTSLEKLATLKTPFRPHGKVTAGNAAGLNDGATAACSPPRTSPASWACRSRMRLVVVRLRRRRARGHGRRPDPVDREGAAPWPA